MGSHGEISNDNVIKATMEELTEDEHRAYLIAEEHLKEQFLQGFKKEHGSLFKRVGEFVMPSFKLNNDKVNVIPTEPSELIKQLSLMVDKKISDAQVAVGETFAGINDEIVALKKGKSVDGTYSPDPSSASAPSDFDQFYGMPPNSFLGQTPPPSSCPHAIGQTGPGDRSDRSGQSDWSDDRSDRCDGAKSTIPYTTCYYP